MLRETTYSRIYIACGKTDLRLGIDGLVSVVKEKFDTNPFIENSLFLFCGTRSDRMKALLWEGDGFLLLYKRLEDGRFRWPRNLEELKNLTYEQFNWLLTGLQPEPGIHKIKAPKRTL